MCVNVLRHFTFLPSSLCGSGRSMPVGGATLLWEWLRLGGVIL